MRLWALFLSSSRWRVAWLGQAEPQGVTGALKGSGFVSCHPESLVYMVQANRPNTDGLRWGPGQGGPRRWKGKAHTYPREFLEKLAATEASG